MAEPNWAALIGAKTTDELLAGALTRWEALGGQITNMNVGGRWRTLIELAVAAAAAVHDLAVAVVPGGFLRWAQDAWLDLKLDDLATERQEAVAARWNLTVGREDTAGNVVIPDGSLYRTRTTLFGDVLLFRQVGGVILPDGQASVQILAEAETAGIRYNVAPGTITEFVTAIPGVTTVSNLAGDLVREGVDQETPEAARERGRGRWPSLARGVVRETLEAWAREVPGVVDVAVDDEHPRGQGSVDVIVTGSAGEPSAELLADVDDLIRVRLLQCINLLVRGPNLLPTAVELRAVLPLDRGDATTTETTLKALVESLLLTGASADAPRLGIGRDLNRGRLTTLGMTAVPELLDLEVLSPSELVTAETGDLIVLDGEVVVQIVRRED